MQEIINYIQTYWVQWLFMVLSILFGTGFRYLSKLQNQESQKNMAISEGVQALLRDSIIQAYNHYKTQEFCPIYAKENVKRMYNAYHALGGNDVVTGLKDELMEMKTEKGE